MEVTWFSQAHVHRLDEALIAPKYRNTKQKEYAYQETYTSPVPEISNSRWIQERSEAGLWSSFRTATLDLAINNYTVKTIFEKQEDTSKLFSHSNTCKGGEYQ